MSAASPPRAAAESLDDRHTSSVRDALTRNVGPDLAARIGYLVSRVFIPPFVLARLGLEMYGLWSTAFIVVSYLGISTFGISSVYVKYVAEYAARGETRKANSLLSTGFVITAAGCAMLFAILFLVMAAPAALAQHPAASSGDSPRRHHAGGRLLPLRHRHLGLP